MADNQRLNLPQNDRMTDRRECRLSPVECLEVPPPISTDTTLVVALLFFLVIIVRDNRFRHCDNLRFRVSSKIQGIKFNPNIFDFLDAFRRHTSWIKPCQFGSRQITAIHQHFVSHQYNQIFKIRANSISAFLLICPF